MKRLKGCHIVLVAIVAVALAELGARYGLGLGDPPVSVADAEIDYLFAPNQECWRFGNRIRYNNLSMRCDFDVDENCTTSRVYVVGDSLINGGWRTDQDDLATTLLQRELPNVQVCNISAGSWGPGNYAAYFRRHPGLRGGTLIVEVGSHDLWEDDPKESGGRLVGKDVAYPDHKPCCALLDACCFIPKACRLLGFASVNTKIDVPKWGKDAEDLKAEWNLKELEWLFGQEFERKALVIIRTKAETLNADKVSVGEARFRQWAQEKGIPCHLLKVDPAQDYRDPYHLNKNGQRKLCQLLRTI